MLHRLPNVGVVPCVDGSGLAKSKLHVASHNRRRNPSCSHPGFPEQ